MSRELIAARVEIRRRYVRSVNMERDVDDADALDGYVLTPSVRDAAVRILAGLSSESCQRAFRIVGPFGVGKSAFGVFLAQLLRERGRGPATDLLAEATGHSRDVPQWLPVIVSGRHVSFARELLGVLVRVCGHRKNGSFRSLKAGAQSMLDSESPLDANAVVKVVKEIAGELRSNTGDGLILLIDEMGRFVEHAASNAGTEDPSIFQALAESSGGRAGADLAVACFLHNRFADYVAGMGRWIEAEWSRSSERYEELAFGGSTEQTLFMLGHSLRPLGGHTEAICERAREIYGEAVDRGVFAASREDVAQIADKLYPLHPGAVAALASATRRFGQNERSVFSFLQSLEPASFKRFAHDTSYGSERWYRAPDALDYLSATISERPSGNRGRRWTLAFDALANAANLQRAYRDVLKSVALVSVLEPIPGMVSDARLNCLVPRNERGRY